MGLDNHTLIVGRTRQGKSTLASIFSGIAKSKGIKIAVLDPILSGNWQADFLTSDPDKFLEFVKTAKTGHLIVIDEAGVSIGKYNEPMAWVVTTSRHLGHSAIIIAHQYSQLPTVIRSQCTVNYVFASNFSSIKLLCDEWPEYKEQIQTVTRFGQGEFLRIANPGDCSKYRLDFNNRKILPENV